MVAPVHVIGGGLAGSEASFQLATAGVPVVLHEMRPNRGTEAHQTRALAELVCSNSFRSDDWATNAVGLLHEEMRRAGSLILQAADAHCRRPRRLCGSRDGAARGSSLDYDCARGGGRPAACRLG
jgi:methylenetetrahydrofolate--tRNA-(uracil-5-)-methyltransferase